MATFNLETSVNALPDTPILPNFPGHPVVKAKILDFSMFKGSEPLGIKDQLTQYFSSCNMIVIKHTETPQPVPISLMTLDDLVGAITQKLKSEHQPLVGDKGINALENVVAKVNAQDDQSASAMEDLQLLAYGCVIDAMAARIIKRGALYLNPFTQKPVLLLGNRGLFLSDKQRVAAAEAREKKALMKSKKSSRTGKPKDDTLIQKKSAKGSAREDKEGHSAGSLDDASVHEGESSPESSEWERASARSVTPVLAPQNVSQSLPPSQLLDDAGTTNDGSSLLPPHITLPAPQPLGIQLAASPYLPLIPTSPHLLKTRGLNVEASAPTFSGPAGQSSKSSRRRSGRSKKSKKSKRARSSSRSRSKSSSSSSLKSVDIPAPRPSVDQVFLLYLCLYSLLV